MKRFVTAQSLQINYQCQTENHQPCLPAQGQPHCDMAFLPFLCNYVGRCITPLCFREAARLVVIPLHCRSAALPRREHPHQAPPVLGGDGPGQPTAA